MNETSLKTYRGWNTETSSSAKLEVVFDQNTIILIFDETESISASNEEELQRLAKEMSQYDVHVVIMTTKDTTYGTDNAALEKYFRSTVEETPGFSEETAYAGCAVNYQTRKISCIGQNEALRDEELQTLVSALQQELKNGADAGTAFIAMLKQMKSLLNEKHHAQEPTPVMVQPTAAPQKTEAIVTQPSQPQQEIPEGLKDVAIGGGVLTGGFAATLLTALLVRMGRQRFYDPQMNTLRKENIAQTGLDAIYKELSVYIDKQHTITLLESLASELSDYPEERKRIADLVPNLHIALEKLKTEIPLLLKRKHGLLSRAQDIQQHTTTLYAEKDKVQNVLQLLQRTEKRLQEIETLKKDAENLAQQARSTCTQEKTWYAALRISNGIKTAEILPLDRITYAAIETLLRKSETGIQSGGSKLLGANEAQQVSKALETLHTHGEHIKNSCLQLEKLQKTYDTLQTRYTSEAPQTTEVLKTGEKLLKTAAEKLNDPTFTYKETQQAVTEADTYFKDIALYAQALDQSLIRKHNNSKLIQTVQEEGFLIPSTIQDKLDRCDRLVQTAKTIPPDNTTWPKQATQTMGKMSALSDSALKDMRGLKALRDENTQNLAALAQRVQQTEIYRTQTILPKWTELQRYNPKNREGFETYFDEATKTLASLADDQRDPEDLYSQVQTLNDMNASQQKFSQAQALLKTMRASYEQAVTQLQDLEKRHAYVLKAKEEHGRAITRAQEECNSARELVFGAKTEREVSDALQPKVGEAEKDVNKALSAQQEKVFVSALEYAQQATQKALEIQEEAKKQIQKIQELFTDVSRTKERAASTLQQAATQITHEDVDIVQEDTRTLLRKAKDTLQEAKEEESELSQFEDQQLAQKLQHLCGTYSTVTDQAKQATNSLEQNIREHERKVRSVNASIEDAQRAIQQAENACRDPRAGTAGDYTLSQAKHISLQDAQRGDSESMLSSKKASAEQATSLANQAEREAKRAIQAYIQKEEEEEREERARRASSSSSFSSGGSHQSAGGSF